MADVQLSGVAPASAASGLSATGLTAERPFNGGAGAASAAATNNGAVKVPAADGSNGSGASVAGSPPSDGQLKAAVTNANQALAAIGTQLVFVFDDQAHHMAIKLLDIQTQKVVQQIPSEAMPATASALSGPMSSGTLVDTKA